MEKDEKELNDCKNQVAETNDKVVDKNVDGSGEHSSTLKVHSPQPNNGNSDESGDKREDPASDTSALSAQNTQTSDEVEKNQSAENQTNAFSQSANTSVFGNFIKNQIPGQSGPFKLDGFKFGGSQSSTTKFTFGQVDVTVAVTTAPTFGTSTSSIAKNQPSPGSDTLTKNVQDKNVLKRERVWTKKNRNQHRNKYTWAKRFNYGANPNEPSPGGLFNNPIPPLMSPTLDFHGMANNNQPNSLFWAKPFGAPATGSVLAQSAFHPPSTGFGGFGMNNDIILGTTLVKYQPSMGTDTWMVNDKEKNVSANYHCITTMKEYENKSLEELRMEDYMGNRKQQMNVTTDKDSSSVNLRNLDLPHEFNFGDSNVFAFVSKESGDPPPQLVVGHNEQKLVSDLRFALRDKVTFINDSVGIKILSRNLKVYQYLKELFLKQEIPFFVIKTTGNQIEKFIISGLFDFEEVTPEIRTELKEVYNLNPVEIVKKFPKKKKFDQECLYVVEFEKGVTNISQLQSIETLFNTKITWRVFRDLKDFQILCKNCWLLGHVDDDCHMQMRCKRCSGFHATPFCTSKTLKCRNCAGSHSADDESCPSLKSFMENKESTTENLLIPNLEKDLFSSAEMMTIAGEIFTSFQECSSKEEQIRLLINIFFKYLNKQ